ncbi:hypothetical protein [Ancylobacter oerskovii]|uniref:Glycosyltransferase n=1 Tax=Ancylobacter oerskovii TaxID=459519 RepID=A0ABW4Z5J9_9HYPH|nr:hypothetical protein [Ancylobacter oerskovii]MBS7543795.1 hypothetical protein [Ancylobacter oerskovii]
MDVINFPFFKENPYQRMLYISLHGRYNILPGTIDDAIDRIVLEGKGIFHIHWDEFLLKKCQTDVEAEEIVRQFEELIEKFCRIGGKVLWTIHNALPHEEIFVEAHIKLRKIISKASSAIISHNSETVKYLSLIGIIDLKKVMMLDHPSYYGWFDIGAKNNDYNKIKKTGCMLVFGKVRRYKNIDFIIESLDRSFLESHKLYLKISGSPISDDIYAETLKSIISKRDDVVWNIKSVSDHDVPTLFKDSICLVSANSGVMTSGVALLSLSMGVIMVAPKTAITEEIFPYELHKFLYEFGNAVDLRRAISQVNEITGEEYLSILKKMDIRSRYLRPSRISLQYGRILDGVLSI